MLSISAKVEREHTDNIIARIYEALPDLTQVECFHMTHGASISMILSHEDYTMLQLCIPEVKWFIGYEIKDKA